MSTNNNSDIFNNIPLSNPGISFNNETNEDFNIFELEQINQPSEKITIFIYDWDDTLLPCSFIHENKIKLSDKIPENCEEIFKKLENITFDILTNSLKYGIVYIITNAESGWVEQSCLKFYPKLFNIIKKTIIISARSQQQLKTSDHVIWKISTFRESLSLFFSNNIFIKNIINIGDSHYERIASFELIKDKQHVILKTIKFKSYPDIKEVLSQLDFLINIIPFIVDFDNCIDINIGYK